LQRAEGAAVSASDLEPGQRAAASGFEKILPHLVLHDFLDAGTVADLLDHVRVNEPLFQSTQVGAGKDAKTDPNVRVSSLIRDLGEYKKPLKQKLKDLVPTLIARLCVNKFEVGAVELEIVAHNEGAFYRRHIDMMTGDSASRYRDRMLSGVYYFHAQPKGFTGGALRLHVLSREIASFIDVEPAHNTLLAFPSFAPHEVMPVQCPSGAFMDSRFAINCWTHRLRPESAV
jgi:Rps23 Pro-64 3,4-dihydroxylase Tpa1-like proline 4-hydroxylase